LHFPSSGIAQFHTSHFYTCIFQYLHFQPPSPKQSCVLSPVVFCLYMDAFLLTVRRTGVRCFIGRCFVGALAYAAVDLLAPSATTLLFVMTLLRSLMFLSIIINSGGFRGRRGHAPVASPTVRLLCCMITSHRYGSRQRPSFLICCSVSVYFIAMCYTSTSYICFVIL